MNTRTLSDVPILSSQSERKKTSCLPDQVLFRARFVIHNSGMRMVGTECNRNLLFILPLGAEWMEWRSVRSGI